MAGKKKASKKPKKSRAELLAEEAKRHKRTKLALIIFAAVALCVIVGVVIYAIVSSVRKNEKLDPMNDNLEKYIKLSEDDYKNYPVTVKTDPIDDVAVDDALIRALYAARETDSIYGSSIHNIRGNDPMRALAVGDTVYAYYIGYTLENGEKSYFDGGCNFGSSLTDDSSFGIGSGKLYVGFELGLVGKNPWSFSQLTKKNGATAAEGDVVTFTMTAVYSDGSAVSNRKFVAVLDESCDKKYGSGFKDFLMGHGVGDIDGTFTTKEVSDKSGTSFYTDVSITSINGLGELPITVAARVPVNDTATGLAGQTVYFDVYVEKVQYYSTPEVDESFVTEKLKMSVEEMMSYGKQGDSLMECYRAYLTEELKASARSAAESIILESFWERMLERVKVKRLPQGTVNEYYNDYVADLTAEYEGSRGTGFASLDEYVCNELELEEGTDWKAVVMESARQSVVEKIIFYYIIREENFFPSDEEYQEIYDKLVSDILDYYLYSQGVTEDNYDTVEEYNEAVASYRKTVIEAYGDQYFEDNVIYEYGIAKILAMADVTYE